jgi:hypothetical protein
LIGSRVANRVPRNYQTNVLLKDEEGSAIRHKETRPMRSASKLILFTGKYLAVVWGCQRGAADEPALTGLMQIPSPATSSAGEPNLARLNDGTVLISWIELQPDSTHALRFATWKDGVVGAPRTIASGGNWFVNWADFPMIAALADGTLAAHWLQRSGKGRYAYDVMLSWSRDNGATWSAPVRPHRDSTQAEHGFVSIFPAGENFGVVWLDGRKHAAAAARGSEDGAEMTVRYTTLSAQGVLGAESEVDGRACDCCQTSVALTSAGPLLAYRDRTANEIRDINVSRYVNGRWTEGKPVQADNWHVTYCPVNGPSVVAAGKRVALAWYTAANDSPRVYVAFSNDAGATFARGVRVDDGTPLGRVDVQLAAAGALVSWLERTEGGAAIRVRRVTEDGRRGPSETVSSASPERPSGFPQMILTNNNVIFAWTEPGKPAALRVATAGLPK